MVSGDVEEWTVAENEMKDHPRSRGRQDDGAEHRRVQVAHDFFECEENGGDRSVEGGGKRSGPTDGEQPPYLRLAQPQPARDDRRDSGSDVDRGSFASQRDAAGERSRAADEFADDRSERDASVVNENRGAGLWNSAAAGEGEVAIEKVAGKERAERGDEDSSPAQST